MTLAVESSGRGGERQRVEVAIENGSAGTREIGVRRKRGAAAAAARGGWEERGGVREGFYTAGRHERGSLLPTPSTVAGVTTLPVGGGSLVQGRRVRAGRA